MIFEDFFWRALIGGAGVALVSGPLGCFIVWRRMAYFGDAVAHSALLGIALGFFLGIDLRLGTLAACIGLALFLVLLQRQKRLSPDTLLGILAHTALSLGLVAISFAETLRVDLFGYLLGDILSVTILDITWINGGGLIALGGLALIWRPLLAVTIHEELGRIDGLTITMLGDLKYGRTVHSLSRLLGLYDVKLHFVAPDVLGLPPKLMNQLLDTGMQPCKYVDLEQVLPQTDVLYVTRVQRERFDDPAEYEQVKGSYVITPETMRVAKERMIVIHPMPSVDEISMDMDDDPRAAYFRQMEYGMYVRMALLALVLGKA